MVVSKSRPPRCRCQAPDCSIDLKPDSLALHPALADSGPASRSIRFGIEDWRLSRAGRPQAQGRLWIARTQEASPPDARNTACRSRCFPLLLPRAKRGSRDLVPAKCAKVNLATLGDLLFSLARIVSSLFQILELRKQQGAFISILIEKVFSSEACSPASLSGYDLGWPSHRFDARTF